MTDTMQTKQGERIITPDMGPFERFQVGDHVAHFSGGDGVVVGNDGREIIVQFDRLFRGVYDAEWFRQHANWLFHRNTAALKEAQS